MKQMARVILLLGTNLGDRISILNQSIELLSKKIGFVIETSLVFESEAWGFNSENSFLNQAVLIKTDLAPLELLQSIKDIEHSFGRIERKNDEPYLDRPIDIDILFYDSLVLNTPKLTIPHKEIQNRLFVLTPLNQFIPHKKHPVLNRTISELFLKCTDTTKVWRYEI